MKEYFLEMNLVDGDSVGYATMTECGNPCRLYKNLFEVITQNGKYRDAYYFVDQKHADVFMFKLLENNNV